MIYPSESDLGPVITKEVFREIEKDPKWQKVEIDRCALEPWYWLVNYCYTQRKDNEGFTHVELFPAKEYLRTVSDDWCRNLKYVVSKSRQLMVTWLTVALHLHLAMNNGHQQIVCQSQKEIDADLEMIQRAFFIWEHLPSWMKKYSSCKYSFGKLVFANKSLMWGVPAGADQLRSHVPNAWLADEFAFMPNAEEAYTAALPCARRFTLVSSPYPGFMDDLVHDRLGVANNDV